MRKTFLLLAALAVGRLFATPAEDRLWATRVKCELNTATDISLPDLTWQQGTTPRLSLDQYRQGKSVDADTNVTAIVRFGPSATGAYFVASSNYAVSGNGYLVDIPTVGTNTTGVTAGWWYTAYFEKSGKRFWTGNGRVDIIETTSTEDALNWQAIASGSELVQAEALLRIAGDAANSNNVAAVRTELLATNTAAAVQITGLYASNATVFASVGALELGTNAWNAAAALAATALQPEDVPTLAVASAATVTGAQSNTIATALQAETDPHALLVDGTRAMESSLNMGGHSIEYMQNIEMNGYWKALSGFVENSIIDQTANGASQSGYNAGTQSIGQYAHGASQSGYNDGTQSIDQTAYGASQSGYNGGTQSIEPDANGASQSGYNEGTQSIGQSAHGASQSGYNLGTQSIEPDANGASQSGYNAGTQSIGQYAYGASQSGFIAFDASATNNAIGAMQLLALEEGQHARTTADGKASLLIGAGTITNKNSIVVGDGLVSNGEGSITAESFYGSGASLTGVTKPADLPGLTNGIPAQIAAATNPLLSKAEAAATYLPLANIPGPGCTDLGTGMTVTLTGATTAYMASPTGTVTLAVSEAAPRYSYALELYGTNAVSMGAGLTLFGSWTPTGTNIVAVVPSTGTLWRVYGRGL